MVESPSIKFEIRKGTYFDSAVLMHLQRALAGLPGVIDAGAVMATSANLELLADSGLLPDGLDKVNPEDLVLVVKGAEPAAAENALRQVDELMKRRPSAVTGEFLPRSLETAVRMRPGAKWVLVSVPGQYAARVADQALDFGRHVFLYSDNVSLKDEIELKEKASRHGLLVMGPDCGTALINGVGFGFANHVRRGRIGLIGASGTGLQALMVYIHAAGGGISQAIGTGGRDLHEQVGGVTAAQALELLARDEGTQVIVLVSKPPAPTVVARLESIARTTGKPMVIYFQGTAAPGERIGNLHYASSLEVAARMAVDLSQKAYAAHSPAKPATGFLRGLFSGGTLAYETMLMLQNSLSSVRSNVALREAQRLESTGDLSGHLILDLGSDEFTVGRLHPMIDNDLRIRHLRQAAEDPQVGLILLDVILGEGAHADPAAELGPVIREIKSRSKLEVLLILLGTEEDAQDVQEQEITFREAGAEVFRHVSQAVEAVVARLGMPSVPGGPPVELDALHAPADAINIGLESFYGSLLAQGVSAVHVDWRPPAGGKPQLMDILQKMKAGKESEASGSQA